MANDYSPARCTYCDQDTWCETRSDKSRQCRACKVERFFERVLYPPLGYKLLPWTRGILRHIYGTVDDNGFRRITEAYLSTGKQNGKSFLEGGLPLYHLLMENEMQPEAYGLASARDQAAIVFRAATLFVEANPELMRRLKVIESVKRIVRRDGGGFYAVLSADGKVQDGKRPSLLLVDELHRFERKSAETVLSVLRKGFVSRIKVQENGTRVGEPLKITVTTAGSERESPTWFSEYQYAQHVINGSITDPKYYAKIWQADQKRITNEEDYWKSREARVAANPSHEDNGGFLADESIEDEMKKAVFKPETKGDYIRLHLNVPIDITGTPVLDMHLWQEGHGGIDLRQWPVYDEELFIKKWGLMDRVCVAGIDLGWSTDMAALSLVFPPMDESEQWKAMLFFWLPAERINFLEERTRAPLADWIARGFLQTTSSAEIDMTAIIDKVKWASRMFDVREVTFDKWGGVKAAANLILVPEGFLCVEVPQTIPGLTIATKRLLALYMNKQFAHANNPIMNWHASCLAIVTDGGDNCKPSKPPRDKSAKRIDGMAATITALSRAVLLENTVKGEIEVW